MDDLATWENDEQEDKSMVLRRKEPASDVFHQVVFDMWEGGVRDLNEIRLETGYTTTYIRTLLNTRGYEVSTAKVRSDSEIDKICADYLNPELKVRHVLKKWALSLNTLYNILDERGVPLRSVESPRRSQGVEQAIQMYADGAPVKDISATTGLAPTALYIELQARGIPLRSTMNINDEIVQRAVDMYKSSSMTVPEIQAETGIPLSRLYKEVGARKLSRRELSDTPTRLAKAVDMYLEGHTVDQIHDVTKIGTSALYRELTTRNVPLRREIAQGDMDKALDMYDKGARAAEIRRVAGCTVAEIIHALKKRGGKLRTGLTTIVTPKNLDYAVDEYQHNVDVETIEIDTLVTRTLLYSTLKKRGIEIRP
jgi:transposase-like protein